MSGTILRRCTRNSREWSARPPRRTRCCSSTTAATDGSDDVLRTIKTGDPHVRVMRLARNSGQTAALACGLHEAVGDIVVAIDGDGENDPADIPRLLAKLAEGYDLVSGWRTERWRGARLSRRLPSVAANRLISWMTGVRLHDYGCTLKAYRRDLAHRLMLYGEMHRFVPAIAAEQGARIAEVEVNFRPRRTGQSKYGPGRIVRTFLDLLTVQISLRLLDPADPGIRCDWVGDGSDRRDMDSYTGIREDRAGTAVGTIGRRCCWRSCWWSWACSSSASACWVRCLRALITNRRTSRYT